MIVPLRPGQWVPLHGPVPQRRRVVILGATEAGVSAAFHLGESALLLEQRNVSDAAVKRWELPDLRAEQPISPRATMDDLLGELPNLTSAETRLGTRVTAIDIYERRLVVSTGESFVYDKLISTLRSHDLQRLILIPLPSRIRSVEAWRYWLNSRDVELLDAASQLSCGDVDGPSAGKRVAESVQRVMAEKYSKKSPFTARSDSLFQPRLVTV